MPGLGLSPLGPLPARAAGPGQGQSPGVSRSSVAWGTWWPGRGVSWALILALLWDLGYLPSPLCVSVAPPARTGAVLGLLEHLETRALTQEPEV